MGLVELQELIRLRLGRGISLDELEEEVIDPAPLGSEQKAELWLYASAMAGLRQRRAPRVLSVLPFGGGG